MREIICLDIGQCGISVGSQFWEMICSEHGLNQVGTYTGQNPNQLEAISVYFNEDRGMVFTPRSLMIDLDKSSMETVRSGFYGQIFKNKNFLFGEGGTGNNWAKGHFSEGSQLCDLSLNSIRKEVEACDCFYGFQMTHSIGGGTGGGLGSLLMEKLKDEYSSRIMSTFSVVPSGKISNCVVEPYNAVLTLNHLIESANQTFCVDNEALCEISSDSLQREQASYNDLNKMVAWTISGITSCMRFHGSSSINFRKMLINLVPFPRLHFLVPGFSPLSSRNFKPLRTFTVPEITNELFSYKNLFVACDPKQGKFLTAAFLFRGEVNIGEVNKQVSDFCSKNSAYFVEWIPNNIATAISYVPSPIIPKTATSIANTTSIKVLMNRIRQKYLSMMERKAFLHWFTDEGMEELEFQSAEANLNDLSAEYHQYEIAKPEVFHPKCES